VAGLRTFTMYLNDVRDNFYRVYDGTNALIEFVTRCAETPSVHDVITDFEIDGRYYCFRRHFKIKTGEIVYMFCIYDWYDLIEMSVRIHNIIEDITNGYRVEVSPKTFNKIETIYKREGVKLNLALISIRI
jgi:hypothetical protein